MAKAPVRIIKLDPGVQKVIDHYRALAIGGKQVATPYYMNEKGEILCRSIGLG